MNDEGVEHPPAIEDTVSVAPHEFQRRGWRFWICTHCYAPRSLHPRTEWSKARPLHDNEYLDAGAPHFKEPCW